MQLKMSQPSRLHRGLHTYTLTSSTIYINGFTVSHQRTQWWYYYYYYLPLLCKLRKRRLCTEEKDIYTFTIQSYNHLVCF